MHSTEHSQICEEELHSALSERRFELHYQPQYSSREDRLVGVEGLVRLRDGEGGLISPDRFVSVVEQTSLIHDLGASLFEQGCKDALLWPSLIVAINVSPVQFRDPHLGRRLVDIARRVGVSPRQIEIEITEGVFFDDPDRADAALFGLRDAGFGIALDDFGTGYSSLGYLLRFPVTKIKLDRSFVVNLPEDMNSATIVHALVALGRALGLKVVAEGIETEAQRQFLRVAGCHLLQGYLFGRALPSRDVSALLDAPSRTNPTFS